MPPPDPAESRALAVLSELVRSSAKPPSGAELGRGLGTLRERLATRGPRRRVLRWWLITVTTVICGFGIGVGVSRWQRARAPEPVAVSKIDGGRVLEGGYLSESGHAGITLSFNEGSQFVLTPGTRGRLRSVVERGAHLAIDHGSASFRITPSLEHRWSVEAGPFLVTVTGTDFSVRWEPATERFELSLRHGRVTVSGPVVGEELVLRPGQKLSVNLPRGETVISEERGDAHADEAPSADAALPETARALPSATSAPSAEPGAPSSGAAATSGTAPPLERERRWKEALAKGQWDKILADVDRDGVEATLQAVPSGDLFALADAARYRRRTELARAALLAHRRRFPESPRALDTTFLLGRVDEMRAGGKRLAIKWYDEYLSRAPSGTYAAEALGRKMILSSEIEGAASAAELAADYLRRFPEGSYASAARALRREP
jgi:ferric-dicitrate binding protein FerR (iron transport regulator)